MFQDAPMFAVSPSYSLASSGSDDDHAVFCFCGNEVERDEDGDVGIYCSVREYFSLPSMLSSLYRAGVGISQGMDGRMGRKGREKGKEEELAKGRARVSLWNTTRLAISTGDFREGSRGRRGCYLGWMHAGDPSD